MGKNFVVLPTLFLLCCVFLIAFVEQANAYCCKVDDWPVGHPPHCNVFGCNCDCLQCVNAADKACCIAEKTGLGCPNSRKRHALKPSPKLEAKTVFEHADKDGDGALSFEEAVYYLVTKWNTTESKLTNPNKQHQWFSDMDLNQNEKLEPNEIDEALTL